MHSSLPKSIEVLSFYIIETIDWTVDSKAMFKNVFLYLNVFSSDEMQLSCILHSQYINVFLVFCPPCIFNFRFNIDIRKCA